MAVPKKKTSKSRRDMRRAHDGLAPIRNSVCACGETRLPHHVCLSCGRYNNKQVVKNRKDAVDSPEE
ncbi:MAG: 50S ribosomal protein L32 [Holosporales bacterium]|nr:50S ribosomal protein L32 [Holosporales bacterium]